jgi:methylmalonyl-CoA/ethylmalonyl-CoA epimerase
MAIEGIDNVGIAVRDLDAVAGFFDEKVGLEVERDESGEPRSATVKLGDGYLYVFETEGEPNGARRESTLTANPPGPDHLSFRVADVDAEVVRLRLRGVVFEGEPETNEAWGIRLVGFRDPEDNSYFLVQNL